MVEPILPIRSNILNHRLDGVLYDDIARLPAYDENKAKVAESYASLGKALKELRDRRKRRRNVEMNALETNMESFQLNDLLKILSKEPSLGEKWTTHRRIPTALEYCDIALNNFSLDDRNERSSLWAAIAYLVDVFQRSPDTYKFQDYLIRTGEEFRKTIDSGKEHKSSKMMEYMAKMQVCYVSFLTNIIHYALHLSLKSFKKMLVPGFQGMDAYLSELNNYSTLIVEETNHERIRALEQANQRTIEQFKIENRMMSERMMEMLQGVGSLLTPGQDTKESPISTSPTGRYPERQFQKTEVDPYITYINSPWIEVLEERQSFLSGEASRAVISLLDKTEVIEWIGSERSALLCVEGYLTAETLNWTSEFALDVIHAAQDRGYAVLYHFCELLELIQGRLTEDSTGTLASTTILKSFMCLFRDQFLRYVESKSVDVKKLRAEELISLDDEDTLHLFEQCLSCLKQDTVLYIVIDNAHLLEPWIVGRVSTRDWLCNIAIMARKFEIVVKILFTSTTETGKPTGLFKRWPMDKPTKKEEFSAFASDAFQHYVLHIVEDEEGGPNQARARLLFQSSAKPIICRPVQVQQIPQKKPSFRIKGTSSSGSDTTDDSSPHPTSSKTNRKAKKQKDKNRKSKWRSTKVRRSSEPDSLSKSD